MKRRVFDSTSINYFHYGGRGISMQDSWHEFAAFLADMGQRPEGKTLDRIDSDGDYCKENCRWATAKQQLLNRRTTQMLTHEGITKSLYEWAETSGVPYQTLWSRVNRLGWATGRALHASKP